MAPTSSGTSGPRPVDPDVPRDVVGPAPGPAPDAATGPAPGPAPRVVLYGRAGCHLCLEARALVAEVAAAHGVTWAEVDVDAGGRVPDGRLHADVYGELVPVVEVDGARVGYWQIDAARLRETLIAPPTA